MQDLGQVLLFRGAALPAHCWRIASALLAHCQRTAGAPLAHQVCTEATRMAVF